MKNRFDLFDGMIYIVMILAMVLGVGSVGFVAWVIVKLLQSFGVI